MTTSTPFRDLLDAANLKYATDGFTSPPKEGVLRIFSPLKIRRLRPGLNPRTWVLKASTLPIDHRSRSLSIYCNKLKILRENFVYCEKEQRCNSYRCIGSCSCIDCFIVTTAIWRTHRQPWPMHSGSRSLHKVKCLGKLELHVCSKARLRYIPGLRIRKVWFGTPQTVFMCFV